MLHSAGAMDQKAQQWTNPCWVGHSNIAAQMFADMVIGVTAKDRFSIERQRELKC